MDTFWSIIIAVGIPSAIVGFFCHRIEKKMDADKKAREKLEASRRKYEVFQVQTLTAVIALSKANAVALKNGKCNGETQAALKYLDEIKHDQRDFLTEQGIEHLF